MRKSRRFLLVLMVLVLPTFALAKTFITIGSGGYTGTYYPVAVGIANLINENLRDIRANAISTGGSLFNVIAIQTGNVQMAMAQNDTCYYAFTGTVVDTVIGKPADRVRGMAALYKQPVHIMVRNGAGIASVADLRGKKVYVGDIGSGTEQNTKLILKTYGLTYDDLGEVVHGKAGAASQLLIDGKIDAMFFSAAVGSSAFVRTAQEGDITFLSLDQQHLDTLKRKYPFYSQLTVPAGTYPKQTQPFTSVAVSSLLVVSADLPEEDVYRIAKLLFIDKLDEFKAIRPVLARYFSLDKALEGMSIPLHKGAARLYKERGVPIPAEVAPID